MPADLPVSPSAVSASENVRTDAVLWYNVGIFGDLGYAVPNPSDDIGSLNPNIVDMTNLIGRGLFNVMHHDDCDLSTPPSINTLVRVHQLYIRAGQILQGRAVPPHIPNLETDHVSPAGEVFRVYPVPYFKVRNAYMKRWAQYALICLAEMMQHTENRKTIEISTTFGAMVGKYMKRIYSNMAVELFGKQREEAEAPEFRLTEADFQSYNPALFFTSQEMIDPVPALDNVFTEDRKAKLSQGIPLTELPKLGPYPLSLIDALEHMRNVREDQINPDTGQAKSDGSRVTPQAVFPQGSTFVL